jgi:hypothetical protein
MSKWPYVGRLMHSDSTESDQREHDVSNDSQAANQQCTKPVIRASPNTFRSRVAMSEPTHI